LLGHPCRKSMRKCATPSLQETGGQGVCVV